jgi:hypothetical protein
MQVSVYVYTKPSKAFCVYRNMAKDHAVHDMIRTEFTEVFTIVSVSEDIVVTTDKNFIPVEPTHDAETFTVHDHVTQVIHLVRGPDSIVPGLDHGFVHLIGISPRA